MNFSESLLLPGDDTSADSESTTRSQPESGSSSISLTSLPSAPRHPTRIASEADFVELLSQLKQEKHLQPTRSIQLGDGVEAEQIEQLADKAKMRLNWLYGQIGIIQAATAVHEVILWLVHKAILGALEREGVERLVRPTGKGDIYLYPDLAKVTPSGSYRPRSRRTTSESSAYPSVVVEIVLGESPEFGERLLQAKMPLYDRVEGLTLFIAIRLECETSTPRLASTPRPFRLTIDLAERRDGIRTPLAGNHTSLSYSTASPTVPLPPLLLPLHHFAPSLPEILDHKALDGADRVSYTTSFESTSIAISSAQLQDLVNDIEEVLEDWDAETARMRRARAEQVQPARRQAGNSS